MPRWAGLVVGMLVVAHGAGAQFTQQGLKLVGTGAAGGAWQGYSVAVSGDGDTAIVGGANDNSGAGAAWVFVRSGVSWSQQGLKLVGTDAVGAANQGYSVAMSEDGNTAIVGGPNDSSGAGAAWVFVRSGSGWSQQGLKLVGTGAVGLANQGVAVAMSADGDTAVVGGLNDNNGTGAVWVFVRSGSSWSQQGLKLVGTGAVGPAFEGYSVAMSEDGNTALVGGTNDTAATGAAWVFVRSGSSWSQQGGKLVGTGAAGKAGQGYAVAMSGDGNTGVVGGVSDSSFAGATWVFVRSGSSWSQQGGKLVGTGAVGKAGQGYAVAMSGDGNTAMVGGVGDSSNAGAVWVFVRSGSAWTQQGEKLVGTDAVGAAQQGYSVAMSGDGNTAIVGGYADDAGAGAAWVFVSASWQVAAIPLLGPAGLALLVALVALSGWALTRRRA